MSQQRREKIIQQLSQQDEPISAGSFARELGVTRQVIVGDVALLRASGVDVIATPRGYKLDKNNSGQYVVACSHDSTRLQEELYLIVECGCGLIDVTVEHPLYGQITCNLHIFTKEDADDFMTRFESSKSRPLSEITNDVHFHRLHCPSGKQFKLVEERLRERGFILPLNQE